MNHYPFKIVSINNKIHLQVVHNLTTKLFTPEEIIALILQKLLDYTETHTGERPRNAVITVPPTFSLSQRQATIDAGKLAGLQMIKLLNETSAAGIGFAWAKKAKNERHVLIYDLGGGSLDVSLLHIDEGFVKVKAHASHYQIGGKDFETLLLNYFVQQIKQTNKGLDIRTNDRALIRMKIACERAICQLSASSSAHIEVDEILPGVNFYQTITRTKFEEICVDLFKRALIPVGEVLSATNKTKQQIDDIVLVGGSSRIPKISQQLANYFDGKQPSKRVNPDEIVALGAAIQAAVLGKKPYPFLNNLLLHDAMPFSLGIQTCTGIICESIPRNKNIPTTTSQVFTVNANNQLDYSPVINPRGPTQSNLRKRSRKSSHNVVINVYESHSLLGSFTLEGIHKGRDRQGQIEIAFEVSSYGEISVIARDLHSEAMQAFSISNRHYHPPADIHKMAHVHNFKDDSFDQRKARTDLRECAVTLKGIVDTLTKDTLDWLNANPDLQDPLIYNRMKIQLIRRVSDALAQQS